MLSVAKDIAFAWMAAAVVISPLTLESACAEESTLKYTVHYGFIDKNDSFKIAPRFGFCSDFLDGLALVRVLHNDGPPIAGIDKNGKSLFIVPERGIMTLDYFAKGNVGISEKVPMELSWLVNRVVNNNGQKVHQVIDTSGRLIWQNPPAFFSNSVNLAELRSEYQSRLKENSVNAAQGKFLKDCQSYEIQVLSPPTKTMNSFHQDAPPIRRFSDGLACIDLTGSNHNARHFFIDRNGTLKFELSNTFFAVGSFHEGLAPVLKRVSEHDDAGDYVNARLGFINKSGKLVVECKYRTHYSNLDDISFNEGLATVQDQDLFGAIDKSGRTVIPFKYTWMSSFHDDLCSTCVLVDSAGDIFDARNNELGYQTKASFIQAYAKALETSLQSLPSRGVVRFDISEPYDHPTIHRIIKGSGSIELDQKLRKMVSETKPPKRGEFMNFGGTMSFVWCQKHVNVAFSPQDPQYALIAERVRLSRETYSLSNPPIEKQNRLVELTDTIGDSRIVGVLGHPIDTEK
jgi:hypothetical protein